MSTLPTAYTPLESLLLFQALRVNGVEPSAFTRISSDLRKIPLIYNDPTFDASRITPEALRQLYLDLLKEEAKRDIEQQLDSGINGDQSPNTRKRKAASPKLPTVREAAQHSHLIPQLLTRLYIRYRQLAVATIRENEQNHVTIVKQAAEAAARSISAIAEIPSSSGTSEVLPASKPASKRTSQARIDDMLNRQVPATLTKDSESHRRSSSGNSMPTLSDLMAPSQPATVQNHISSAHTTTPGFQQSSAFPQHAIRPTSSHGSPQLQHLTPRASASPRPVLLPPPPPLSISNPVSPSVQYQARGQNTELPSRFNQPPYASTAPSPQHYYNHNNQRTAYTTQEAPLNRSHARGGVMLPPFQLNQLEAAKDQPNVQQQYYHHNQQQHLPQSATYQHPHSRQTLQSSPSTEPRPQYTARTGAHPLSGIVAALATPPREARQTIWKSETRPPPLSAPGSPKRPDVEPLSPLLARAPSPSNNLRSRQARSTRRQTSHIETKQDLRSASVESSAHDSADTYSGRRRIKPEPSTPGIRDSEERETDGAQNAILTRTRRGTLQSSFHSNSNNKRQRQVSSQPSRYDEHDEPPARSKTITAVRNFGRLSSVIMNEIIGHKHGSRFAQPVRDSHADGYSTFIKRPQDLKSIRAAISQGSKAIIAATANTADSPAATTSGSVVKQGETTVELERSIDLMPPKAIVNAPQLEKELMRMFANAVMFNPGEDGMVADAREMFEDVESKIAEWRGADREVVASADDEDDLRVKRRKL